jgi:hypothetical protein
MTIDDRPIAAEDLITPGQILKFLRQMPSSEPMKAFEELPAVTALLVMLLAKEEK